MGPGLLLFEECLSQGITWELRGLTPDTLRPSSFSQDSQVILCPSEFEKCCPREEVICRLCLLENQQGTSQ